MTIIAGLVEYTDDSAIDAYKGRLYMGSSILIMHKQVMRQCINARTFLLNLRDEKWRNPEIYYRIIYKNYKPIWSIQLNSVVSVCSKISP